MAILLTGVPRFTGVDINLCKLERDESFSLCALEADSPEKIVEVGDTPLVG